MKMSGASDVMTRSACAGALNHAISGVGVFSSIAKSAWMGSRKWFAVTVSAGAAVVIARSACAGARVTLLPASTTVRLAAWS